MDLEKYGGRVWEGESWKALSVTLKSLAFTLSEIGNDWRIFEQGSERIILMTVKQTVEWIGRQGWKKMFTVLTKTQPRELWLGQQQ